MSAVLSGYRMVNIVVNSRARGTPYPMDIAYRHRYNKLPVVMTGGGAGRGSRAAAGDFWSSLAKGAGAVLSTVGGLVPGVGPLLQGAGLLLNATQGPSKGSVPTPLNTQTGAAQFIQPSAVPSPAPPIQAGGGGFTGPGFSGGITLPGGATLGLTAALGGGIGGGGTLGVVGTAPGTGFFGGKSNSKAILISSQPVQPKGYHPNRHGYYLHAENTWVPPMTVWVKNRRRNPLNPRALHRSLRRLGSARHAVHKLGLLPPIRHGRLSAPKRRFAFRKRRAA